MSESDSGLWLGIDTSTSVTAAVARPGHVLASRAVTGHQRPCRAAHAVGEQGRRRVRRVLADLAASSSASAPDPSPGLKGRPRDRPDARLRARRARTRRVQPGHRCPHVRRDAPRARLHRGQRRTPQGAVLATYDQAGKAPRANPRSRCQATFRPVCSWDPQLTCTSSPAIGSSSPRPRSDRCRARAARRPGHRTPVPATSRRPGVDVGQDRAHREALMIVYRAKPEDLDAIMALEASGFDHAGWFARLVGRRAHGV